MCECIDCDKGCSGVVVLSLVKSCLELVVWPMTVVQSARFGELFAVNDNVTTQTSDTADKLAEGVQLHDRTQLNANF